MNGYILSHEDAMALCAHAARLLDAEGWEDAKCVCTVLARTAGTLAEAQLALYMANNSIKNEDALLVHLSYADTSIFEEDPLLKTALFYADPALAAKLKGAVTVKHDEPNPALAEEIVRLQQHLSLLASEHASIMCNLKSINPDMDPARHSAAILPGICNKFFRKSCTCAWLRPCRGAHRCQSALWSIFIS